MRTVDLDVDERQWSSRRHSASRCIVRLQFVSGAECITVSVHNMILYYIVYHSGPRLSITKCILASWHTAEIPIWFKCKIMWRNAYLYVAAVATAAFAHFYICFRTPFFSSPLSFISRTRHSRRPNAYPYWRKEKERPHTHTHTHIDIIYV